MSTEEPVSERPRNPEKRSEAQRKSDTQRKLEFMTMVRRNMENKRLKESSSGNYSPFPKEDNPFKMGFGLEEIKLIKQEMERMISKIGLKDVVSLRDNDEIMKLQQRIAEVEAERSAESGFSLYGTKDEEGLHEGNQDYDDSDGAEQDDYDIGELEGDPGFSYEYGPTHHIEVELSDGPAGDNRDRSDEPSCEFTFEYDRNGKLVPTYCNVEEQLRFMNLQSREKQGQLEGQHEAAETGKKKKKKNNKKKKKQEQQQRTADDDSGCLFCQYEAFFGVKPVHMMRWYDQKVMNEERHRQKVREKLEKAKSKALKRQQTGYNGDTPDEAEDSDGSRTTVVDQE